MRKCYVLLLVFGWFLRANGQAGSLNPDFGSGGYVTTHFINELRSEYHAIAVQPDGKIVAVGFTTTADGGGDFAIARYNPNGTLDNTFSDDGKQTTDFGGSVDAANAVAIQKDGKIVVAGGIALARYNPDGLLDATFSDDGKLTSREIVSARSIAIQSDGKIVVVGSVIDDQSGFDFITYNVSLARYNQDGTLDNTFSGDGVQTVNFNTYDDLAYSVALQKDNKIVVAVGGFQMFAVARFNTDGSLDATFSDDGIQNTLLGGSAEAYAVAVQEDQKILLAGSQNGAFALIRYNPDGSLDKSFSEDGIQTTSFGVDDLAYFVGVQADGKIVAAGHKGENRNYQVSDFAVSRYNSNGSLDTTFSGDGKQTTDFTDFDEIYGAVISNNQLYVAGQNAFLENDLVKYIAIVADYQLGEIAEVKTWYRDADGDGYGNKAVFVQATTAPEGYVADNTDCDDTDPDTHPSLNEYKEDNCSDGKDNDCDGLVDEDFSIVMLYRDKDGDGFGDAADAGFEGAYCATSKDKEFVQNNEDCDDNDAAVHPGAAEICGNGKDDNCDGQIDEGCTPTVTLTCPPSRIVATGKGSCSAIVAGIDPVVSDRTAALTYTLSGATIGSGTGTASGTSFNKGVTTVTYTLANNASINCSFTVTVVDKEVPVITGVSVTPSVLWPANHKMVNVTVNYNLWDNCGAAAILSVKGNDGTTSSDWQVVDAHHVLLRAERSGSGDGRTYIITIAATDASGNKSKQTVEVNVPHDMSVTWLVKSGLKTKLDITVLPNPSYHFFTIRINSNSNRPVQLRVTDAVGRVIEGRENIGANTAVTVGHNYRPGVYYAEVLQNGKKAYAKLIKTSQ